MPPVTAATGLDERDDTSLTPRARRLAKTRRAIVDAARDLIDDQGYDRTTIEQIADRADIAPRTFFRYFPSKESLLFADLEDIRAQIWSRLDERPEREAPLRSLVTVLAEYGDAIEQDHERLSWGFRVARDHPGLAPEVDALRAETIDRLAAFVARRLGVEVDVDPRPRGWAVTVMGLFSAVMSAVFVPKDATTTRLDVSPRAMFLALVDQTGLALRRVGAPRGAQGR
jgi:AcrR family transcriptional regulator